MALVNLCITNDFRLPSPPPARRPGTFPLPPPPDDWYATRKELSDAKSELLAKILELETARGIAPVEDAVAGNVPALTEEGGISDGGVALKDLATASDVEKAVDGLASEEYVNAKVSAVSGALGSYATKDEVSSAVAGKADKAEVESSLAGYVKRTEVVPSEKSAGSAVSAETLVPPGNDRMSVTWGLLGSKTRPWIVGGPYSEVNDNFLALRGDVSPSSENAGSAAKADYAVAAGSAETADLATSVPWTGVTGKPTKVSAFENDSGYLTEAQVELGMNDGYVAKAEYATFANRADTARALYTEGAEEVSVDKVALKADLASKADLVSGKVPVSQLPSYVSDVLEYGSKASFPASGEAAKIYVAKDTNLTYRWSGTAYVEVSPSLALGETAETAYAGSKGKALKESFQTHLLDVNPHGISSTMLGVYAMSETDEKIRAATSGLAASSLVESLSSGLDAHVSDAGNPHKVTAEQVGAYTMAQIDTYLAEKASQITLFDHLEATNNPHRVTAKQAGAVPTTCKVNGKALSADVTLAASDVGAVPSTAGDLVNVRYAKYNIPPQLVINNDDYFGGSIVVRGVPANSEIEISAATAENGSQSGIIVGKSGGQVVIQSSNTANGYELDASVHVGTATKFVQILGGTAPVEGVEGRPSVNLQSGSSALPCINVNDTDIVPLVFGATPTSRKVNGKELSADVTLGAADVGAYTKEETDSKVKAAADSIDAKLAAKQDTVSDLDTIRAGAAKGATALQTAPVTSVNGEAGAVTLDAADVGALPASKQTDGSYAVEPKTTFGAGIDLPAVDGEVTNVKGVAAITPVNTGTRLGFVFSDGLTSSQSRLLPDGSPVLTQSLGDARYAKSSDAVGASSQLSVMDGQPTAIEHGKFYCWKASSTAPTSSAITLEDNGLENEARLYLDYRTAASQITFPSGATVLYRDGSVKLNAFEVGNRYFVDLQWFSTSQREGDWESSSIVVVNAYKVATAE